MKMALNGSDSLLALPSVGSNCSDADVAGVVRLGGNGSSDSKLLICRPGSQHVGREDVILLGFKYTV